MPDSKVVCFLVGRTDRCKATFSQTFGEADRALRNYAARQESDAVGLPALEQAAVGEVPDEVDIGAPVVAVAVVQR